MSVKANFKSILITRDPMTKTPKVVAPWEVPAFRSSFGDENVQVLDGDVVVTLDELPEAEEEFSRLRAVFGVEGETKQSHIDIVYGRGIAGVKALEAAIKASLTGDVEKAQAHADKSQGFEPDADVKAARKASHDNDADPLADEAPAPAKSKK